MNGKCDMFPVDGMVVDQSTPKEVSKKGEVTTDQPQLKIDPDFLILCRPQKDSGHSLLQKDLKENGCRDPIVYWRGPDIIVDGHQRYEICNRLGIPYRVTPLTFETKDAAINWIIESHFGCRNLSGVQKAYHRGKRYHNEKKAPHRPIDSDEGNTGETAQRIAEMLGVSPSTIERNGSLTEAIDGLREKAGDEFVGKLLDSKIRISMNDIIELSKRPPEEVTALVELLEQGKKFAEAEGLVNPTAETAPMDKNIQRIEDHLGKVQKILSKVETTTESSKLEELLATIEQIRERIIEIKGAFHDDSPDDHGPGPESQPQDSDGGVSDLDEDDEPEEETDGWNKIDPDCDDAAETEDDGDSTELFGDDPSDEDDPAALPPGWDSYEEAMEKLEVSG